MSFTIARCVLVLKGTKTKEEVFKKRKAALLSLCNNNTTTTTREEEKNEKKNKNKNEKNKNEKEEEEEKRSLIHSFVSRNLPPQSHIQQKSKQRNPPHALMRIRRS